MTANFDLIRVGARCYLVPEGDAPWAHTLTTVSAGGAVELGLGSPADVGLLDIVDVAHRLGKSKKTVYEYVATRQLVPTYWVPGSKKRILFAAEDVDRFRRAVRR